MIMLSNDEIVSDDEAEYERIRPLVDEGDESREECAINGQVGLGLVARRVLTAQLKEDDTQCENIFYTQYLIKDKVLSLIIDGDSCTNVASTLMVEKFCDAPTSP